MPTLNRRGHPLAIVEDQRAILRPEGNLPCFSERVRAEGQHPLRADRLTTMQINLGKLCNQTCQHCHVDAGPDRREIMTLQTMEHCLQVIEAHQIETVDLTGGAPEMNPHFRWFVEHLRTSKCQIIDRCNLTILTVGQFRDLPEFFAEHRVEVVASLPCYSSATTDAQRGQGVFERSILALKRLNALGYGRADSDLVLNLVYNPHGAFLPPPQDRLEAQFREQLLDEFGIGFNRLFAITNMPINRYLEYLQTTEQFEDYMSLLVNSFNSTALGTVMCRSMISVDWDGRLSDCDFNQQLGLGIDPSFPKTIEQWNRNTHNLVDRPIQTGMHCYACTAGRGSSCGGQVV